ncbi:hypothetical protein Tco_1327183 [Tanacetum coccineum]
MIPLYLVDAICLVCRKACLDSFGEHAVHCKELPGFKYRHDTVRNIIFYICRRAGISAKKEAHVNFLTDPSDGRSTLRPADVLVFGCVRGKYACVDLTRVSPLMGLSSRGFTAGQSALKSASCKVTKHEKTCIENQHVFIPFAFESFGFLAPDVVELLSRIQWVMHNNFMTPRSADVIFKRIGFAIQKGLAAQLVARLPSTTIYKVKGRGAIYMQNDDGVVDAWCEFLNSLESLRAENSMSRFFLPTFTVLVIENKNECEHDKKLFGIEAKANESVTKFLLDVEKVNERGGRKSIKKEVDLNCGHKFLICFNMKYPAVNLIDSKNNLTKDGDIKSMVVTNTNDMVVATLLQKGFGKYLVRLNHNKAADVLRVEVKREDFYWQTDKKLYDYVCS